MMSGKKTYIVSSMLAVIGIFILGAPPSPAWDNLFNAMTTIIGVLMIAHAASTASTRHAIFNLESRVLKAIQELKEQ